MTRVSTYGNYQSALLNLMSAQGRQQDASTRLSTQKNATDLTGFGRTSETLTALKGAQARLDGFIQTSDAVAARLSSQDLALTQINDAITVARDSISNTVGMESVATLMLDLEGVFQSVQSGLNFKHQGNYLFAGGNTDTAPVDVADLAALSAAPNVASIFRNDQLTPSSRVAEGTTVQTGYLANDVGTEVFQILRDIQDFNAGPDGPLIGRATEVQKAFLTTQLGRLEVASRGIVDTVARNGSLQNQVETVGATQVAQRTALDVLVADRVDADIAQAITDLELAQFAVQASAKVVSELGNVSLLNYLR